MKWKCGENHMIPESPLTCPFCKTEMVLRWSNLHSHADIAHEIMRKADRGHNVEEDKVLWESMPSMYSYVDDQRWKCPDCHFAPMFGIPVSLTNYRKMKEKLDGASGYLPLDEWRENELIKKQLKDLGYF